jgi:hypothetical protein
MDDVITPVALCFAGVFFGFLADDLGRNFSWVVVAIAGVLVLLSMAFLLTTACMDPGFIPRDSEDMEAGSASLHLLLLLLRPAHDALWHHCPHTDASIQALPCLHVLQASPRDAGVSGEWIYGQHKVLHHLPPLPAASVLPLRRLRQLRAQV